ncbi:MAG: hypothetical protein AseanaTS_18930 [Candidatus Pelagadaptatus aseana]|uniref:gamma-glutamylcyclotransferase family protein n=1 Tax=Candidatus Pelagadaptatus aseana TaxID=3120508 RepID=UPI0039B28691
MTTNLFVYGLLQHPEVLKPLIGYVPKQSPARLYGHIRRTMVHPDFEPCAVAVVEEGKWIDGVVLHDVTPRATAEMDVFECVPQGIYQRVSVVAELQGGEQLASDVYLKGPSLLADNLGDYWCQDHFNQQHMEYVLTELIPKYAKY